MKYKLKIRHYVSIIALLALIPTLILGVMLAYDFLNKGQNLKKQHLALANQISKEVFSFLKIHLLAVDTLAKQVGRMNLSPEELNDVLKQVAWQYEGFSEIYLDIPGCQLSSKILQATPESLREKTEQISRQIYEAALPASGKSFVSSFFYDRTGRPAVFIYVPIAQANATCGYIMGILDINYLNALIDKYRIYPSAYTILIDNIGHFLAFPEVNAPNVSTLSSPVLQKLKEKNSGSIEYRGLYGRWEIASYTTIPEFGWGVWVTAPQYEVMLPLFRAAGLSLALITFSIAVILSIGRLLENNIAKPLTHLNEACQQISSGNLFHRVELQGTKLPVEINTLAQKFNYMAANMQHTNTLLKLHSEGLESRVKERTRELVLKNKELSVLYAVASAVSTTRALSDVLANVAQEIVSLFEAEVVTIWVTKDREDRLIHCTSDCPDAQKKEYERFLEVYSKQAILDGKPVIIQELDKKIGPASFRGGGKRLVSLVSVPIIHDNNILGTITLASCLPNRFSRQELAIMQAINSQLAVVITNVSLFNVINEEHNTLLAVMDSINEGLVLFDAKATIIYVNPVFSRIFGMEEFNWQGLTFQGLQGFLSYFDANIPYEDLWDDFKKKKAFQHREAMLNLKDKTRHYLILGFPVMSNQNFIGYGYLFRDITREKEVEYLKNSILSTVSHELRTPLTTIRGSAESLLRKDVGWPEEEKREFLVGIVEESKRLQDLIDNIMDMSKIEAGVLGLDLHVIDIRKVIHRVLCRFKQRFQPVQFSVEHAPDLPLVCVDERRIEQVLSNLVENGIKYSKETPYLVIKTAYLKEQDMVKVSVIDHGIGIDPEYYEAIFERFYRINHAAGKEAGGSGLGLSISKGIVEAHGGRLWVASNKGQGSQFDFTIPCKKEGGNVS
ncbi:MAG: ATP-binding protein [Peptococcaceae bacterium]|nr:ATP-binding protein [Peptococcaceae bacterium]MDH7525547.1 ATP-binding protein [Peptococcaceae bacterium]